MGLCIAPQQQYPATASGVVEPPAKSRGGRSSFFSRSTVVAIDARTQWNELSGAVDAKNRKKVTDDAEEEAGHRLLGKMPSAPQLATLETLEAELDIEREKRRAERAAPLRGEESASLASHPAPDVMSHVRLDELMDFHKMIQAAFPHTPNVYDLYLRLVVESPDEATMRSRVRRLFEDHPSLVARFEEFLGRATGLGEYEGFV